MLVICFQNFNNFNLTERKKAMKNSLIMRFVAIVTIIALMFASFSLAVGAVDGYETSDNTLLATTKYVSVTEYDFITHTERTYQMSYTDYEFSSISPGIEILDDEQSTVSPNAIINDEDWSIVPNNFLSSPPYSAVCSLYAGGRSTAFIVGKRLAMTCAHCVYNASSQSWDTSAYLMPHAPGNTSDQTIINNGTRVLKAIIPTAYKNNPTVLNDCAILIVEDDIGTGNAILPLNFTPPTVNMPVYVIGYPSEGLNEYVCYMHISTGKITAIVANAYRYNCDTVGGNSGSPVIWETTVNGVTKYNVIAIHRGGNTSYNVGHKIDQFLVQAVRELNATYQ